MSNILSVDLFSASWHSDTAKGVISHQGPMAKYELMPPFADPLETYLQEKDTLRYKSSEEATIMGLQSPHGNTSVKGRYPPLGTQ